VAIAEAEPGLPDRAVLERAVSEQRILLTFDRDFGGLIYRSRLPFPPGLILLRFVPLTPEEPAQLLLPLTGRPEILFEGRLTVLDRERVRQRPLPKGRAGG
jgi:predicted nuclease of predicted toxin-antitoxin system